VKKVTRMSSLFSDFMGSRLRARNLRCYFDNLKKHSDLSAGVLFDGIFPYTPE
jgi:hypothetical protein